LSDSTPDQIRELLDPAHGLSLQDLDDNIDGDNHAKLIQMLEAKLPGIGKDHMKRSATPDRRSGACTADRALKIDYAQKRAAAVVQQTVALLDKFIAGTTLAQVGRSLACYFGGAQDGKTATAVREVLSKAGTVLGSAQYVCPAEPFERFVIKGKDGQPQEEKCDNDELAFAVLDEAGSPPQVALCPAFFSLAPATQARALIHEATHHGARTDDFEIYAPKCGQLTTERALNHADSYAYFAMALENEGVAIDASADCPQEWKEKLLADARTAQAWVNGAVALLGKASEPGAPAGLATQLQRHFKIDQAALAKKDPAASRALQTVNGVFSSIQSAFGGKLPFECDAGAQGSDKSNTVATTPSLDPFGLIRFPYGIRFFRVYFDLPDDERAATVVHEMAHKYANRGEQAYMKLEFNKYVRLSTDDALDNADSYAQFARYAPRG
jgi:hypothetical protein